MDLLSLSASALIRAVEHHRRPVRPRPLLLLSFASALRRSELVGLDAAPGQTPGDPAGHGWIEFCDEGIRVHLTRSKTDQQGEGRSLGVPLGVHLDTCPVTTVKA